MHTMHLRDQNDGQCLQKNVQFIHHDFAVILPVNLLIHMEFSSCTRILKKTHAITAQLLLTSLISTKKAR